ncbi:MAG: 2-isopropylmalate synthase, partial [Spirochaetota bacterium]
MLKLTERSNLLEARNFEYALQDVDKPELYREHFPYSEVPRIAFNHRVVPIHMPNQIWITDTTFRDGQQSRTPYTREQIVRLFTFLHRLGGPKGLIRQSEFFLYSERDRAAIEACRSLGYEFPEITSWIRASQKDFELVKEMQIEETGILVSCSDYHIFQKLKMKRSQAMEHYLTIVKNALDLGIKVRCHLEDITRADIYGFVIPFAIELRKLSEEAAVPLKLRVCDTMGYGVSTPGVTIPRSVGGIIYGLLHHAGFPSEEL